jgi:hypothetical protein
MGREGLRGKGRDQGSGVRDQGSGDEEQRVVVAFSGAGRVGGWSRLGRFPGPIPQESPRSPRARDPSTSLRTGILGVVFGASRAGPPARPTSILAGLQCAIPKSIEDQE